MKRQIKSEYQDDDGYWIILADGWQFDGQHAIVEDSKTEARSMLRFCAPCNCADCKPLTLKELND